MDRMRVRCDLLTREEEIAELKAELASAYAEADRVRGLWKQLLVATGEPNCHLLALEEVEWWIA